LGMIALVRGDYANARRLLTGAIDESENPAYNGEQIMALTLAALATELIGDSEGAAQLLRDAERKIQRGRLNGVDHADIYYSEAVILTMRDESDPALEKLQEAYNRGFREQWVLDIDGRLAPLHDRPEFQVLKNRISEDVQQARAEINAQPVAML
ncbi:MAG: hypothetical protein HKP02_10695, partial [Xanthomonadales bacterium]|nr:hypothetical protein [Xanthomonadales bacterium]